MKLFCKHLIAWFEGIVHKASSELRQLLPVVIGFVQAFKTLDDLTGDVLAGLIGGLAPAIQDKIKAALPKVLVGLRMVQHLENASTPEQINAALEELLLHIELGDDQEKQRLITTFAALILQELEDGKLSFAECVTNVEYYFKNFVKQPA